MKKQSEILLIILLASFILSGCKDTANTNDIKNQDEIVGTIQNNLIEDDRLVSENELDSEQYSSNPIMIDVNGYDSETRKVAYFTRKPYLQKTENDLFYVVDAENRNIVYEGKILSKKRGDFSSVKKTGYYYIEVPYLGRSRVFFIGEGFQGKNERDLYSIFTNLLMDGSKNENFTAKVESLLWMLRYDEKKNRKSVVTEEEQLVLDSLDSFSEDVNFFTQNSRIYANQLSVYGSLLLQLSKNLKDKDGELANDYLEQAKDIYSLIAELPDYSDNRGVTKELWFYLNAGLYYMTGEGAYREETEKYIRSVEKLQLFSRDDSEEKLSRDEYFVYGAVTYLNTTYDVDVDYCDKLMNILDEHAQKFVSDSKKTKNGAISVDERNRLLVDRLFLVSVIERVIISQEYLDILSQGVHYICGCNEKEKNYVTPMGIYNETVDNIDYCMPVTGAYLYLLYELNHAEFEKGN